MNENKIPCGGFYLGDGLAMDGNTLKSLSGAYVKVTSNDDGKTFEFMDDSPLKTYKEIVSKCDEADINLMAYSTLHFQNGFKVILDAVFALKAVNEDGLCFHNYYINTKLNKLFVTEIIIAMNSQITQKYFAYTLTPAT